MRSYKNMLSGVKADFKFLHPGCHSCPIPPPLTKSSSWNSQKTHFPVVLIQTSSWTKLPPPTDQHLYDDQSWLTPSVNPGQFSYLVDVPMTKQLLSTIAGTAASQQKQLKVTFLTCPAVLSVLHHICNSLSFIVPVPSYLSLSTHIFVNLHNCSLIQINEKSSTCCSRKGIILGGRVEKQLCQHGNNHRQRGQGRAPCSPAAIAE